MTEYTANQMLTLGCEVSQGRDCLSTQIDGQVVLMSVSSGVYGGLDQIGSRIWQKIETPQSVRALVDELAAEYQAPRDKVEADVIAFLRELNEKHMVQVKAAN